jgi:formylglycine-generating enzyme required for sulfatase activity
MEHKEDFPNLMTLTMVGAPPSGADLGDTWTRPADGMVMVYAPGGEFGMGSDDDDVNYALQLCQQYSEDCTWEQFQDEQPRHTVTLDGFWIDETEVTNAQYQRCVGAGVCEKSRCWEDEELNAPGWPVVCVTWNDAQAYCEWAGGRLPTEAEWEYAARGPEENIYPWGNEFYDYKLNYCDQNCWADERKDASVDDGYAFTSPVGNYPEGVSWCGTLDMAGNAWEWVYDWYGPYPAETQVNPTGPETGEQKVLRSGSWDYGPDIVRAANRTQNTPDVHFSDDGFRCVVTPAP